MDYPEKNGNHHSGNGMEKSRNSEDRKSDSDRSSKNRSSSESSKNSSVSKGSNSSDHQEKNNKRKRSNSSESRSREGKNFTTVYVKNIPENCSEKSIESFFKKYGDINSLVIMRDRFTQEALGYCFVTFATSEQAKECIEQTNNAKFEGRTLRVEISNRGGPRKSTPGKYLGTARKNFNQSRDRRFPPRRRFEGNGSRGYTRDNRDPRDYRDRDRDRPSDRGDRDRDRDRGDRDRDRDRSGNRDRPRMRENENYPTKRYDDYGDKDRDRPRADYDRRPSDKGNFRDYRDSSRDYRDFRDRGFKKERSGDFYNRDRDRDRDNRKRYDDRKRRSPDYQKSD